MNFIEKIKNASVKSDSLVCVGLDTDIKKIPDFFGQRPDSVLEFNKNIISKTHDMVCAYKPNSAFYESLGAEGIKILENTCRFIPDEIPVILDVKRGDIGNTAKKYAEFAYDIIGADAVTINPYMGYDTIKPFLRDGKCVFVLCLTSNLSSNDFQMLETKDGSFIFEKVAKSCVEWSKEGGIGLVVGATKTEWLKRIRDIAPDLPILVPGIGAQDGDLDGVIKYGGGKPGLTVINSSRSIIFASGTENFAQDARSALEKLREEINTARKNCQ